MKTYSKTHTNKKAADAHLDKIKKRGGKATLKTVQGGLKIDYQFPEANVASKKTVTKKATRQKKYDVISPDGFTIRIGVPLFKSIKERDEYFELWKKRFERQGYYSSNRGRIELDDLARYCDWIEKW